MSVRMKKFRTLYTDCTTGKDNVNVVAYTPPS